jgi:cation diffusion facilitator CzcD-associated flavoprotein CzcO
LTAADADAGAKTRNGLTARIIIVGAGFAGLCMALRLRQRGQHDFLILEQAASVGGTWRDNTYPGAACDVESHLYSFSFRPNPAWSRTYGSQAEILGYLNECAVAGDLMPDIRLGCTVVESCHDSATGHWTVTLQDGSALRCRVLVVATGPLSRPALPVLPGLASFAGRCFHTARWDHAQNLRGQRVGIVGTGASAVQCVPRLAAEAVTLTVFQRTAPWVLPKGDRRIAPAWQRWYRALPAAQRVLRWMIYWRHEALVIPLVLHPSLMGPARHLARRHLRSAISDPQLRSRLEPDHTMGCKRILLSDDYLPALALAHVHLETSAIAAVEPTGIRTRDGRLHELDMLILATGFATGNRKSPITARGRNGVDLEQRWAMRPQAYLGTAMRDFPNLFLLVGPNTGLGHNSMIFMIEAQVDLVLNCLDALETRRARSIEVRPEVEARFNAELQSRLQRSVWATGCRSWYLNEDGSNSSLWPDFTFRFRGRARRFRPADWCFR